MSSEPRVASIKTNTEDWIEAIERVQRKVDFDSSIASHNLLIQHLATLTPALEALLNTASIRPDMSRRLGIVFGEQDTELTLFDTWRKVQDALSPEKFADELVGFSEYERKVLSWFGSFPGSQHGPNRSEVDALMKLRLRYDAVRQLTTDAAPVLLWLGYLEHKRLHSQLLDLCRQAVLEIVRDHKLREKKADELLNPVTQTERGRSFVATRAGRFREISAQILKLKELDQGSLLQDANDAFSSEPPKTQRWAGKGKSLEKPLFTNRMPLGLKPQLDKKVAEIRHTK